MALSVHTTTYIKITTRHTLLSNHFEYQNKRSQQLASGIIITAGRQAARARPETCRNKGSHRRIVFIAPEASRANAPHHDIRDNIRGNRQPVAARVTMCTGKFNYLNNLCKPSKVRIYMIIFTIITIIIRCQYLGTYCTVMKTPTLPKYIQQPSHNRR